MIIVDTPVAFARALLNLRLVLVCPVVVALVLPGCEVLMTIVFAILAINAATAAAIKSGFCTPPLAFALRGLERFSSGVRCVI